MSIYAEVWVPKFSDRVGIPILAPHAHITFGRPGDNIKTNEDQFQSEIMEFCERYGPLPFALEGYGRFVNKDSVLHYIPVIGKEILEFNNGLEKILEDNLVLKEKLWNGKILHLTTKKESKSEFNPNSNGIYTQRFPHLNMYMLRLTIMKGPWIWFSWDFIKDELLNRNCSRDEKGIIETEKGFEERFGYVWTEDKGYVKEK